MKPAGQASSRKLYEGIGFLVLLALVGLEMHLVFHRWWPAWEAWFQSNPVTPTLLVIGLMVGPVAFFLWAKTSGRRMGEEAEEIGRGLRR